MTTGTSAAPPEPAKTATPQTAGTQKAATRVRLFAIATVILLIAFGLRTIGITSSPPGLSGDEGINATDADNVWRWGIRPIFFTNNYGREAGFIYMMALSVKLIGTNVLAVRIPAIACGTAAVLMSFVLLHRLWNLRVAALAAALMSVSLWPIFVSRVGLRAVSMIPLQALAAYSLWRGLQSKGQRSGLKWWLTLGGSLGLIPYTYIPGRIFPFVLAAWWVSIGLLTPSDRRPNLKRHLPAFGLAIIIALAIFAPFGRFIIAHPEQANQRVNELSGILDSLRGGDLRPLLTATVRTLGMFTFVGDQYWRYNVAFRPVFDWATGLLFYAGAVLCCARIRRPHHQLILIWLGAMLTPSILAPGSPSFLRATGAILPIYALPAIALDGGLTWMLQRAQRRPSQPLMRAYAAVATIGLIVIAVKDGIAYFVTWTETPRTREVYTAGLAQIGRQLNLLASDEDTAEPTVLVGCDFATDYAREMVRFQTAYTGEIRWFTGRSAMVFPAPPEAEVADDAYYLLADALPPETLIEPIATQGETLYMARSRNGAFESGAYRLPAEARKTPPWEAATPLDGHFEGAMRLLGYTAPITVQRGSEASFLVIWEIPTAFEVDRSELLWFHVALKDPWQNTWETRADLLPYAIWEWHPGDVVAHWVTIPIAADVPPGELTLAYAIEKKQAPLPYATANRPAADAALLGPITVVGAPVSAPSDAPLLGNNQEIALSESLIIGVALPGEVIHATLFWHAVTSPEHDYTARLTVREGGCTGTPVYTKMEPLWPEHYPTSQWQPGERVRSFHHPRLPRDLAVGPYAITIDLVRPGDPEAVPAEPRACYPLEIVGHRRQFDVPDMDVRLDQPLADGIKLLGYQASPRIDEVSAGDTLELTLIWHATGQPSQPYTVFTHLYDPEGTLVAQHDGAPCDGSCPTSAWITDEVLSDVRRITVPSDAPAGAYTLGVGMYDSMSLERLTIPQTDEDAILIPGPTLP
jgi:hypothetical protein